MRSSSFMFSEFAASHVTTHRCDNVTLYVTVGTMASVLCCLNTISALLAAKLYN